MGDSLDGGVIAGCPLELQPPPPPPEPPPPAVTIRASIFFDGTLNNRTNTSQRIQNTWNYRLTPSLVGGSYENDYSNVANLEAEIQTQPNTETYKAFSLYIEGIGTLNGGKDDLFPGAAYGTGATGVKAKVNRSINEIIDRIGDLGINTDSPLTIILDSFGFSRGAAAARYFIYQVLTHESEILGRADGLTLQQRLRNIDYHVTSVGIKFVGLFDTVASYGRHHDDDTTDLHLDAISNADRVVQLAAADEHRINFPLTNIDSASNKIQIFLPGVHSDIGGGYVNMKREEGLSIYKLDWLSNIPTVRARYATILRNQRDFLIEKGWYLDSDFIQEWNELKVNRVVSNTYSKIPLKLMADYARQYGLIFSGVVDNLVDMATIKTEHIDQYISQYGSASYMSHWTMQATPRWLKNLRYSHFHYSANYDDIGMAPQFWSSTEGWEDSIDNRIAGERKRKIYDG
ncbi:MAG: DUF2235 domain-containing protein [Ferruginibacter sp.]